MAALFYTLHFTLRVNPHLGPLPKASHIKLPWLYGRWQVKYSKPDRVWQPGRRGQTHGEGSGGDLPDGARENVQTNAV
jgi:hypothetical protein